MGKTSTELLDASEEPAKPTFLESLIVGNKESLCGKRMTASKTEDLKPTAGPLTSPVYPSQFLGKVKDFLGAMATANAKLEDEVKEKSPADFDIEAITGEEPEYIEMDLLLGVADLHTEEAVSQAEATLTNFRPSKSSSTSTCSGTEDSDEDYDENNKESTGYSLGELDESNDVSSCDIKPSKRPKIIPLD